MTVWQWLVGLVGVVGGLLVAAAKADLEDEAVYRWLARKLIYRAALRLPRGERARWRAEAMRDVIDLPGRLAPFFWALDTYRRSGSWGRDRGAPSRWQVLCARARAAWQWLRALPTARARAHSRQRHPANNRETAQQIMAVGIESKEVFGTGTLEATLTATAVGTTRSSGSADLWSPSDWSPSEVYIPSVGGYRDGKMHLSDPGFLDWLCEEREGFEADIDRKVEAWRAEAWQGVEARQQRRT